MEITLTPFELEWAEFIATYRNQEAKKKGLKNKHGLKEDSLEAHILGVSGEMAFAKAMNIYYGGLVNTFKKSPDVDQYEIRTRSREDYDLIIRPDDHNFRKYILVTQKQKSPQDFFVRGWMFGKDAKQEKWLKYYGNRPGAYFVPQAALQPMPYIIQEIKESRI